MRDMSRDSHVTHSHSKCNPFLRKLPQQFDQLLIIQVTQSQFAQAIREASLQSVELLAPVFDGHDLRILPCCREQAAFQYIRYAGKCQGVRLERKFGSHCCFGDPHNADRIRQRVCLDMALQYACLILGGDRINISSICSKGSYYIAVMSVSWLFPAVSPLRQLSLVEESEED